MMEPVSDEWTSIPGAVVSGLSPWEAGLPGASPGCVLPPGAQPTGRCGHPKSAVPRVTRRLVAS